MDQKIIIPLLGAALISIGAFGAVRAYAEEPTSTMPSIVTRIAERFNLNVDDVKSVFDEEYALRHEAMKAKLDARLSQLVNDGMLTAEKKQLILDKRAELQANREQLIEKMRDLTPEERRELMQAHREDLKAWANENGIDVSYLHFLHKFHGKDGMNGNFMMK